jgi:hypothetical protein
MESVHTASLDAEAMHVPLLLEVDVGASLSDISFSSRANPHTFSSGLHHLQRRVKIGYAIIAATYVATELSILLGCHPLRRNWQIYPDPGSASSPFYLSALQRLTTPHRLLPAGHLKD